MKNPQTRSNPLQLIIPPNPQRPWQMNQPPNHPRNIRCEFGGHGSKMNQPDIHQHRPSSLQQVLAEVIIVMVLWVTSPRRTESNTKHDEHQWMKPLRITRDRKPVLPTIRNLFDHEDPILWLNTLIISNIWRIFEYPESFLISRRRCDYPPSRVEKDHKNPNRFS